MALTAFGGLAAAAVGADLLGRRREARALGAATVVVGGYLGSYTGVLLASTAVPLWARSRLFLGPIFVATATATGAATCRLVLTATGADRATLDALGRVEVGAMAAELGAVHINHRRLGPLGAGLAVGRPGRLFKGAKWAVRAGIALRLARRADPRLRCCSSPPASPSASPGSAPAGRRRATTARWPRWRGRSATARSDGGAGTRSRASIAVSVAITRAPARSPAVMMIRRRRR